MTRPAPPPAAPFPVSRPERTCPPFPCSRVSCEWPLETLEREFERARALIDSGRRGAPLFAVRLADRVSRRWLARWDNPRLKEIDAIAPAI